MEPNNTPAPETNPQPAPSQPVPSSAPSTATSGPKHNVGMAVLAYLSILVIVSYLVAKDDPFVKFHIKQGLILLVIEVALSLIGSMVYMLWPVINILNIVVIIFAIIGIVNAVKGHEKELPIIGKFAAHFKI